MTAKLFGGILVGVFVAAAGGEIVRRKYPKLAKKILEYSSKISDFTGEKIKNFTASAGAAFRNGYDSAKTGSSKS